ncbi:unnamed protein product, partial [Iphiclides podalirius]
MVIWAQVNKKYRRTPRAPCARAGVVPPGDELPVRFSVRNSAVKEPAKNTQYSRTQPYLPARAELIVRFFFVVVQAVIGNPTPRTTRRRRSHTNGPIKANLASTADGWTCPVLVVLDRLRFTHDVSVVGILLELNTSLHRDRTRRRLEAVSIASRRRMQMSRPGVRGGGPPRGPGPVAPNAQADARRGPDGFRLAG